MGLFKNWSKNRTERVKLRQQGKTERTENRTEAKSVAYMNGINPTAPMWAGISSLGNSASSVFGGGIAPQGGMVGPGGSLGLDPQTMRYVLIGGAALLLLK